MWAGLRLKPEGSGSHGECWSCRGSMKGSDLRLSSPTRLGQPHPSFQAGNHTLRLEGQGTNAGRKGLLTAAKKQTIPRAQWQDGPTPSFCSWMYLPTPRPLSLCIWVVQTAGGGATLGWSLSPHPTQTTHRAVSPTKKQLQRGGPPPHSQGSRNGDSTGPGQEPRPCHSWVKVASASPQDRALVVGGGETEPRQGEPRVCQGAGSQVLYLRPGSCCSACWSGESRCAPGTPASAPRLPPSCGDSKERMGGRTTWAAGPQEPGLRGQQIRSTREKSRRGKKKTGLLAERT